MANEAHFHAISELLTDQRLTKGPRHPFSFVDTLNTCVYCLLCLPYAFLTCSFIAADGAIGPILSLPDYFNSLVISCGKDTSVDAAISVPETCVLGVSCSRLQSLSTVAYCQQLSTILSFLRLFPMLEYRTIALRHRHANVIS